MSHATVFIFCCLSCVYNSLCCRVTLMYSMRRSPKVKINYSSGTKLSLHSFCLINSADASNSVCNKVIFTFIVPF